MEADVGILYHSVSHPAIKEIELAVSRLVCVGHPSMLPDAPSIELNALEGHELVGPAPADPLGRLLAKRLEELSVTVDVTITAQSYHSLVGLAARSMETGRAPPDRRPGCPPSFATGSTLPLNRHFRWGLPEQSRDPAQVHQPDHEPDCA